MLQRSLTLILYSLLITSLCSAQENKPGAGFCIEANAFMGKVIKHTPKFKLPIPEMSNGADVNLQWKTYGKKEWHQRRRYPKIGIGFTYTNYGIDSVYGKCFSIYPNLEIPLITGKRLQWTLRIGDGVAFVTKKYTRQPPIDTLNNAISSTINDYGSFMTDIRYHISDKWDVQAGINFSHISNASFHQPNLGINMYGTHIGIKYYPTTSTVHRIKRELKPLKNRWLAQFRLTMSYNESNAPLGPTYPIYLATAFVSKRWISKNKAFAGIDYSYHEQLNAYVRDNTSLQIQNPAQQAYKVALLAGNEFLLGRVGVVLQVGYYLKPGLLTQSKIYQKLGGNFYLVQQEKGFIKEAYICAFLKTHTSVAELAELGFGMSF